MRIAMLLPLILASTGALAKPITGEIVRDPAQPREFMKTHLCPTTELLKYPCPGYVVDHILPLKCGGKDSPDNMQLQTIAEGRRKDYWEIRGDRTHPPCSGLAQ